MRIRCLKRKLRNSSGENYPCIKKRRFQGRKAEAARLQRQNKVPLSIDIMLQKIVDGDDKLDGR